MVVVEMLSIASVGDCQMGAALIAGKWHSLIALDRVRLGALVLSLASENEARWACYLALELHTAMKRAAADSDNTCFSEHQSLPKFEELSWVRSSTPQSWIESYFAKPVWPEHPINTASRLAHRTATAS